MLSIASAASSLVVFSRRENVATRDGQARSSRAERRCGFVGRSRARARFERVRVVGLSLTHVSTKVTKANPLFFCVVCSSGMFTSLTSPNGTNAACSTASVTCSSRPPARQEEASGRRRSDARRGSDERRESEDSERVHAPTYSVVFGFAMRQPKRASVRAARCDGNGRSPFFDLAFRLIGASVNLERTKPPLKTEADRFRGSANAFLFPPRKQSATSAT